MRSGQGPGQKGLLSQALIQSYSPSPRQGGADIKRPGWVYRYELGWIYLESEDTRSIWLWKQGIGWAWTSIHLYPYLYRYSASDWIFLDGGGASLWNFYDFGGGGWMQLGE